MLLTRRNEGLEAVLRSYLENQRSNRGNDATRGVKGNKRCNGQTTRPLK